MADNKYTFTGGEGPEEPKPKDIDLDHDSPHHTLGRGPLQAAPGVHQHVAADIPDLPVGAPPHTHTEYSATAHTHPAITNADTVDNMHFNWDDRGAITTYFWGVNNYGDSFLVYLGRLDERFADEGHDHGHVPRMGSSVIVTNAAGECTIWVSPWGGAGIPVICNGDFPAHPRAVSLINWTAADGRIACTNMNASQAVRINWVVG